MRPRITLVAVVTLLLLFISVVGLQAVRDRVPVPAEPAVRGTAPDIQSPEFVRRAVLAYDSLAADVYWMRVVQQYGRTKLSRDANKKYDFLYPMLQMTTSLDPEFEVAYRFGAIFLAEPYPGGAGRPDLAIDLLQKGLTSHPTKWQYAQDIAFVHYWWRQDYVQAADWFKRAARLPLAPNWLAPMAAVALTEGGNREAARRLWVQVFNNTEADWLMEQASFRLVQLDALDQMDALEGIVRTYQQANGRVPGSWEDLVRVGLLRGVPADPRGTAYVLSPDSGTVTLAPESSLNPLPKDKRVPR